MVASVTGPVMAMREDAAYAAAKAGMTGLTRAAAIDTARHGITGRGAQHALPETLTSLSYPVTVAR